MRYNFLPFFFAVALLSACGTKKQANSGEAKSNTKLDYAYIEKFHKGVRLKSKGENKEAIKIFEECATLRESDDAVHFALSQLYMLEGDLLRSGNSIQKAAELDPDNIHYISENRLFSY